MIIPSVTVFCDETESELGFRSYCDEQKTKFKNAKSAKLVVQKAEYSKK